MTDQAESHYPAILHHKHGLSEWEPMLPERSSETIVPGEPPAERSYRCQRVGCDATVRIDRDEARSSS